MSAAHQWHYMAEGLLGNSQTIGPITEAELLSLATQGKLRRDTPVSSPTRTSGQWHQVQQIPGLLKLLEDGERSRQEAKAAADRERQQQQQQVQAARQAVKDAERQQRDASRAQESAELTAISCTQDLAMVRSIRDRVQAIITSQERIEYIAIQQKPVLNVTPDAIVVTNRRLIFYRPKLLGRYDFEDYQWFDLHNAHLKQNMIGATFMAQHTSGRVISLDYLPKEAAEKLYRIAQEREEHARLARHQLHVDTLRAGAAQVNVQTNVPSAPPPAIAAPAAAVAVAAANSQDDLLKRLETLKSMADKGLITADDFERRKNEILSQL